MELLNPRIVIRENGWFMRWRKIPYRIAIEAGVETESHTTRYGHTRSFADTYCRNRDDIVSALPHLHSMIDWGGRKMMVLDTTGQFRDVTDLEND